jgi:putative molybdopterin biosynthesis protein
MANLSTEFLTTRELAELLHIKERKVYDLAASGEVPCSRATGKLLFPRRDIEAWIASRSSGGTSKRSNRYSRVFVGSQDPLLEWSLRASGAELATLFDGSLDGLERFAQGEGQAAALHLYDPETEEWNVAAVRNRFEHAPAALVEFAWRQRGLIVAPALADTIGEVADLRGRRVSPRQETAGSQVLLRHLMAQADIGPDDVQWSETARTESEAALAVHEGHADATLGLKAMARRLRLGFVPVIRERFDLLVDRAAWFDPPLQRLIRFCRSDAFRNKAAELSGYDISGFGTVHFNGG